MTARPERFPLFAIMVGNATVLSVAYLGLGLLLEVWRRVHPSEGVLRASLALDRLPAGVLRALGLLEGLREAYFEDRLNPMSLRVVFGLTTVAIIFGLAIVVGVAMWGGYWIRAWRAAGRS